MLVEGRQLQQQQPGGGRGSQPPLLLHQEEVANRRRTEAKSLSPPPSMLPPGDAEGFLQTLDPLLGPPGLLQSLPSTCFEHYSIISSARGSIRHFSSAPGTFQSYFATLSLLIATTSPMQLKATHTMSATHKQAQQLSAASFDRAHPRSQTSFLNAAAFIIHGLLVQLQNIMQ